MGETCLCNQCWTKIFNGEYNVGNSGALPIRRSASHHSNAPLIHQLLALEGLHGFTDNGTTFPSPVGLAASFDTQLIQDVASVVAIEAEGLGLNHIFAPVLDLSRELRWGRVEENFGESPYLTGELGYAYVHGLQDGQRRNTSSTAIARVAATCKHFAAFGSPQSGL
jgi:beta-glucosidase